MKLQNIGLQYFAEGDPAPTTDPATAPGPSTEKTFTQAEVDKIVGSRIAKALKGIPGEEELASFRAWKDSQKTEKERWDTLTKEKDDSKAAAASAQAEVERLKRENYVLSKGLTGDEAEFIAFKAAKMVDDKTTFEAAVDELTKETNPSFNWTGKVGDGVQTPTANETMNALIRGAFQK